MLLSLLITAKYFRHHTTTFGYAAERWFRQELVETDIPCWPNYYSLLCCHTRWSSKTTGLSLPASSGDGDEHRLALWSWLSRNVSWTGWSANCCQMFASLSVLRDFCQYIPLWIWTDERCITFDRLWQNFLILPGSIVWIIQGGWTLKWWEQWLLVLRLIETENKSTPE